MKRLQFLVSTLVTAFLIFFTPLVLFRLSQDRMIGCILGMMCQDPDPFAQDYFEGLVPFTKVLASAADLPRDVTVAKSARPHCAYAIVELAKDAPVKPPAPRFDLRGQAYRWGYLKSGRDIVPGMRSSKLSEAIVLCGNFWPGPLRARMRKAAADPDTYRSDALTPGLFFLYSAEHRLAMRLKLSG